MTECTVKWSGGRTWCRVVGDLRTARTPVVVVHGGPAMTHDYLNNLDALGRDGRPVVYYDQVGAGRSEAAHPESVDVDLLVEEFSAVLDGLGLDRAHLLGHSWGGMLGLEIALAVPDRLQGAVFASTTPSTPLLMAEWQQLMEQLEPGAWQKARSLEDAGETDSAEYARISALWSAAYFCRVSPMPTSLQRSFEGMNLELYQRLWGAKEYFPTGLLQHWDVRERLGEIALPCLLTSGRYDQQTPACQQAMLDRLSDARWIVYEYSSHVAHLEEPEPYANDVADWLAAVDRAA